MIKIGKISYTNILPIYYFFNEQQFNDQVSFIPQIPAQLNRQMKQGKIDLGPISSFAYAENASSYVLFPDLSISCKGKVRSIFLFSKKPVEELDQARIALTSSSATSVALLKILLQHFYGLNPSYDTMEPSLESMLMDHDAALLIGDDAIHAQEQNRVPFVYDLGELWYKFTQRDMTFAVWAVRKEITQQYPELLLEVYNEFQRSKAKGLQKMDKIVLELSQTFGQSTSFWETYFRGLSYDFSDSQIESLEYFYGLAHRLGLLDVANPVELWNPKQGISIQ